MTAVEKRKAFHDTYKLILGRNVYSQNYRDYVYTPRGGVYYSDCSSSICATLNRIGVTMSNLNTAGMYNSSKFEKVNVTIKNGHISQSDISKLRVGMCLMFRGNDPSRPLQIGHVESIYEINGTTERDIIIAGHGSGNPSTKVMYDYLSVRQGMIASNGLTKGLVAVLNPIPDDVTKYNVGWNQDANGWWYANSQTSYLKNCWQVINHHKYYFNKDGYALKGWQEIDGNWYFFETSNKEGYVECALYVSDANGVQRAGTF